MNVYVYKADLYCEVCGESIRNRLRKQFAAPPDPDDEVAFDSDQFPKGPYAKGGGKADSPQHCAGGYRCLEPLELEGDLYGAFLENELTEDGLNYVRELLNNEPGPVENFWKSEYGL